MCVRVLIVQRPALEKPKPVRVRRLVPDSQGRAAVRCRRSSPQLHPRVAEMPSPLVIPRGPRGALVRQSGEKGPGDRMPAKVMALSRWFIAFLPNAPGGVHGRARKADHQNADTDHAMSDVDGDGVSPPCEELPQTRRGPVRVWGYAADGRLWRSSSVVGAQSSREVLTRYGTRVMLSGELDRTAAAAAGLSHDLIEAFRMGFPDNWRAALSSMLIGPGQAAASSGPEEDAPARNDSECGANGQDGARRVPLEVFPRGFDQNRGEDEVVRGDRARGDRPNQEAKDTAAGSGKPPLRPRSLKGANVSRGAGALGEPEQVSHVAKPGSNNPEATASRSRGSRRRPFAEIDVGSERAEQARGKSKASGPSGKRRKRVGFASEHGHEDVGTKAAKPTSTHRGAATSQANPSPGTLISPAPLGRTAPRRSLGESDALVRSVAKASADRRLFRGEKPSVLLPLPAEQASISASFGDESDSASLGSVCKSWTREQLNAYDERRTAVQPGGPNYWSEVAAGVPGKTAAACAALWDSGWSSPNEENKKRTTRETGGKRRRRTSTTPEIASRIARKSGAAKKTAKFKQDMRRVAAAVSRDINDDELEPDVTASPGTSLLLGPGSVAAAAGALASRGALQKGTPDTAAKQRRFEAERAGSVQTPEILARGRSFGLAEADQYLSVFHRRRADAARRERTECSAGRGTTAVVEHRGAVTQAAKLTSRDGMLGKRAREQAAGDSEGFDSDSPDSGSDGFDLFF